MHVHALVHGWDAPVMLLVNGAREHLIQTYEMDDAGPSRVSSSSAPRAGDCTRRDKGRKEGSIFRSYSPIVCSI